MYEAETLYRQILQAQPNHPLANHNLGVIAMLTGYLEMALPYLQNAWRNSYQELFCRTLTECLLRLDRVQEALQIITNGVRERKFSAQQTNWLLKLTTDIAERKRPGIVVEHELSWFFNSGRHAELTHNLHGVLSEYPEWVDGWNMLCTTLQILGEDESAALERVLELTPLDAEAAGRRKIFCIGANKTGTTSVESVFRGLGLVVGHQAKAEMLMFDWAKRDFRRIVRYCYAADAFQDVPFSVDDTFRELDRTFSNSKFILTVRNNANEWYESLVRFHTRMINRGRTPTADDLRQYNYRYPGYLWDVTRLQYGSDESRLYDRDTYIRWYEKYNNNIKDYFSGRPGDLLVLNVADPDAMERLLTFLGYPYTGQKMPHLNAASG